MGFDETKLMNRRATLISLLRSLQKSLEQNDQISDGPKSLAETKAYDQEAGIKAMVRKPVSTISHRGVQLAEEVHAKFDHGGRGSISFKEFRGYLAAIGRPHEHKDMMENEESWQLFFDDLGGLDEEGRVTPYGMVKYRELMEEEHGLEMDLLKLKMSVVPKDLTQWLTNKACFDMVDFEDVVEENKKLARRLGKKKAEKELKWEPLGKVGVDALQQLMGDIGETYTYEQLQVMLYVHQSFLDTMEQLRARFARRNEFSTDIQKSVIDASNKTVLWRDGFLAFLMARRERPAVDKFEKFMIRSKTKMIRGMRELGKLAGRVRKDVEKLVDREILTPRILGGLKADVGEFNGIFTIGDNEEVDEGMSARLEFKTVERAATEFAAMKLPRGCGTAIVLDFLARSDASPREQKEAVRRVSSLMKEHFDRDLSKLPLFHSWKVYSHKGAEDGIDVIRLSLCFDRASSIDYVLRELDMGFSFVDLLTEFNAEVRCSLNITDLLDSKRVTLEKDFHFQANTKLIYARALAVKILDEFLLKAEEEKRFEETLQAEIDTMQGAYDKRTEISHPVHPEYGRIRIGVDVSNDTVTGKQLETQKLAKERKRRTMWRFVNFLRGAKSAACELTFKNIVDFLFGSKLVRSYLPEWVQQSFFEEQGSSTVAWRKYSKLLRAHMLGMIEEVSRNEEQLKREKELEEQKEAEKLGGMSELQRRREQLAKDKKVLALKLESLGIKMDPNLLKKEVKELSPAEMRRSWWKTQSKSRMAFLKMYIALQQCCIGVQAVTVLSGTNKFELSLQGFDIFE
eukprot:CAMPEP_0197555270 /NCGR_PEP_ID=MMETSP1320-20131121/12993_1 /TAXON_ID=91990 /ORGANISM="Bolidomonas sp., Strain RCC2347" /LENGTH=797 /DNA_ID=CAMNT_0043116271 /DNA_START=117 /DNA_END=2507 /DNA_ORIENTATION=+